MGANTSIAERYADGVILIPNAEDPKNISVLLKAIDSMIHNETAMEMQSKKAQALYKETILRRDRWQMIKGMIKTVLALLHF
jgi:trehalose-6-phosphate synthase